MTNPQTNWTTEYRYKCANGFYKNVLDRAYVLYSGHKAIRMIGAMQDITEITEYRHSLERKVEKRTLELQAALSKEKEMVDLQKRFISIASHEFRTPLSTISLAAGFIKKFHQKLTSFEIKKRLDSIDTQVVRMNDLLQDVLTVSKIDSGKDEVHWKDIDLKEIIESIVAEVGNSTQGTHQINFIWKCKQQQFKSDENKIRTILINLLNNAVKFSQEKIDLEVSCSKNEVRLRVKDYGVGIPQEEIGKLFQPFYRASNASFITGTGLGLSIVSKAVEMLGGRIEVQSELNKGTEFKMQLPIQ
ncbi:MAG TPA: hypothetical protein DGG95_12730 [Cytophagales bacterium]|nr:hypothetical protein [Cytophagales bacterium]